MKIQTITSMLFLSLSSVLCAQTLTFGLNAGYPPFESKNDQNEIIGFDVDIAKSICKDQKVDCQFVDQAFDSLITNLKFKRFDAIISSMDITAERAKIISFSKPYYQNDAIFVSPKEKLNAIADLKGKNIGVLNGSTHQKYLLHFFKDSHIKSYPQYASAIVDLENGRVDAVFGDQTTALEYLKTNSQLAILGEPVKDKVYFDSGLGIGVRLDDPATLEKINQSLDRIKASGEYQQIYDKWFKTPQ